MQRRTEDYSNSYKEEDCENTAASGNCAWCGDPPDQYGSHGICTYHAEQIIEQAHTRKQHRS